MIHDDFAIEFSLVITISNFIYLCNICHIIWDKIMSAKENACKLRDGG